MGRKHTSQSALAHLEHAEGKDKVGTFYFKEKLGNKSWGCIDFLRRFNFAIRIK